MPKPQTVLCYICGREFGSYSINVHERQCAKRWESQRNNDKKYEKKSQEKLHDPWVKRHEPSRPSRLRGGAGASKSMIDIRPTDNIYKEVSIYDDTNLSMVGISALAKKNSDISTADSTAVSRPETAIISKINLESNNVDDSSDITKDGTGPFGKIQTDSDHESKIPRPGTAVLSKKPSGTSDSSDDDMKKPKPAALAKRYSSPLLPSKMNANSIITGKSDDSSKHYDSDHLKAFASLRKHSAPEVKTCSSPDSSTSSQVSSDSTGAQEASPPRFRSTKNPNLLVCYICGNEFGSKSLKIHEPQCLKKWKLANPRYYSRKGNHGGMFKADSINSLQKVSGFKSKHDTEPKRVAKQRSASCENLLDVGLSGNLQSSNSLQALKELSKSQGRLYHSTKPKMEPCYICGKEVIKHSLAVHEKQCKKKWDSIKTKTEQEEKEKKRTRSSTPSKRHSAHLPITIKVDKVNDNHNNNNVDEGQKENQASQENRGKTQPSSQGGSKEKKPSMVTCYLCGRAYGSASISIHEKQCQKKWEAQQTKAKEQERSLKKTRPRPRSFVL